MNTYKISTLMTLACKPRFSTISSTSLPSPMKRKLISTSPPKIREAQAATYPRVFMSSPMATLSLLFKPDIRAAPQHLMKPPQNREPHRYGHIPRRSYRQRTPVLALHASSGNRVV